MLRLAIRNSMPLVNFALGVALGAIAVVLLGFANLWRRDIPTSDFSYLWVGARTVVDGLDPYVPTQFFSEIARYGTQHTDELVWSYPPWALLPLLPFALLSLTVAAYVWMIGGIAFAIYGFGTLVRRYAYGIAGVQFFAGFALVASQPALISLYSGQWSFWLLGAVSLAVRWIEERHERRGAIAGLVMLVKPQLFVFAIWAIVRTWFVRGERRAIVAASVGGLGLICCSWLLFPGWLEALLTYVVPGRATVPPRAVTVATPLGEVLGPAGLWWVIPIIAVVVLLGLAFDPSGEPAIAAWIAASVLLAPYSWSYDHLVLLVPFVMAVGIARGNVRRASIIGVFGMLAILVGSFALYQFAAIRGSQSLNVLVPLTVFATVTLGLWPWRGRSARRVPSLGKVLPVGPN